MKQDSINYLYQSKRLHPLIPIRRVLHLRQYPIETLSKAFFYFFFFLLFLFLPFWKCNEWKEYIYDGVYNENLIYKDLRDLQSSTKINQCPFSPAVIRIVTIDQWNKFILIVIGFVVAICIYFQGDLSPEMGKWSLMVFLWWDRLYSF